MPPPHHTPLQAALLEVRPARGRRDEAMARRFEPHGVGCKAHARARTLLRRLVAPPPAARASGDAGGNVAVRSALLVPEGAGASADASSLAAWAGCLGAPLGDLDYVRFVSVADLLSDGGGASEDARSRALAERFVEAKAMRRSMLILDDIDLLLAAGSGAPAACLSPVLTGALRSLLKEPLDSQGGAAASELAAGNPDDADAPTSASSAPRSPPPPALIILATASDAAAASALATAFDRIIKVPLLHTAEEAADALRSSPALALLEVPSLRDSG